ncbi:MAG: catalase [Lachnospiraceae bacterium]|nr:catalase [Lachnospiraceae bacterium]
MNKLKGHFMTITEHKLIVMKYCFRMGLFKQGLLHDLSKYSPAEFIAGVKYFQGDRSPNAAQREEKGYSAAWMHHKGRNKHHYEYWHDIGPDRSKGEVPVKMPIKYVAEMFADRIAACRTYEKEKYTDASPAAYYERTKNYIKIHPQTRALLEKLIYMLKDKGEDATFSFIKKELLTKRDYHFKGVKDY